MVFKITLLPEHSNFIADHAKLLDINFTKDSHDIEKFIAIRLEDEENGIPSYIPHVIRRIAISEIKNFCVSIDDDDYNYLAINNHSQYDSRTLYERLQFIIVDDEFIRENDLSNKKFNIESTFNNFEGNIRKIYLWDVVSVDDKSVDIKKIFPYNSLLFTLRPTEYVNAKFSLKEFVGLVHSKATSGTATYRFNPSIKSFSEAKSADADLDINKYHLGYERIDTVSKIPLSIDMAFESIGKISAHKLFEKAVDVMIGKLQNLGNSIIELENGKFFKIQVNNEEHTLGSFLEQFIMLCIREQFMDNLHQCTCFYRKPYETENYIIFTLKIPSIDGELVDIRQYFNDCVQRGIDQFEMIKQTYLDLWN